MNVNKNLLQKKFGKNLIINESLSKYNWFNLGGSAELFFRPENENQLKEFLDDIKKNNLKISILGAGSNLLIRDGGIKGAVIKLGSKFSSIKLLDKKTIEVGASALDRKVSDYAKESGISGFEFLACIPGSIGGAIVMNSGCYGSEISNILYSMKIMDFEGKLKIIKKDEIKFSYREINLPKNSIILSAVFEGVISSKEIIEKKQNELINMKKKSQPSRIKTGGSTFKNQENKKAWSLIKESGCDNFFEGDAKISEKHSNFFINAGKASASDIEKLIFKVRQEVKNKTGVNLELEIKIIGDEI